jgi:hypothetical protein
MPCTTWVGNQRRGQDSVAPVLRAIAGQIAQKRRASTHPRAKKKPGQGNIIAIHNFQVDEMDGTCPDNTRVVSG